MTRRRSRSDPFSHRLVRFARALRKAGVGVSVPELLDAARALDALPVEDRAAWQWGLESVCARRQEDLPTVRQLFQRFFQAPPDPGETHDEKGGGLAQRGGREGGEGGEGGRRPSPRPAQGMGRAASDRPESPQASSSGSNKGRSEEPAEDAEKRPAQALTGRGDPASAGRSGFKRMQQEASTGRRGGVARQLAPVELSQHLDAATEAGLVQELRRLVQRVPQRPSRRQRAGRRGRLDVHRSLRANLATGGVPFRLVHRHRRTRPVRLLALLDVSHSALRAAGLFLLALKHLLPGFRDVRLFTFVDRPVDATRWLEHWLAGRLELKQPEGALPGRTLRPVRPRPRGRAARGRPGSGIKATPAGPTLRQLVEQLPGLQLGAPSDYGRTLYALQQTAGGWLRRDTVLLVLGDGRSNWFDPCPWALEELARQVGRVAWLVPEPPSRWGTGDSALPTYAPWCDEMVPGYTVAHLVEGLERALAGGFGRRRPSS